MDHKEMFKLLKQLCIPVAYDHFSDNKVTKPPFMAYREQPQSNFRADNIIYSVFPNYEIELVTSKKDVELEKRLSSLLTEHNISYEKTNEIWDNQEKIYHIFYEI